MATEDTVEILEDVDAILCNEFCLSKLRGAAVAAVVAVVVLLLEVAGGTKGLEEGAMLDVIVVLLLLLLLLLWALLMATVPPFVILVELLLTLSPNATLAVGGIVFNLLCNYFVLRGDFFTSLLFFFHETIISY